MHLPLDEIEDGYKFQRIIAEYFRSLKSEKHDFHISDIHVEDNGVGGDDGCDIIVEFHFEDAISRHFHRWVIECKSQKKAVSLDDISTNNLESILKAKSANGYLLICKNDATAKLKRIFNNLNSKGENRYIIWSGDELWHRLIKRLSLIQAFFPDYYRTNFLNNNAAIDYDELVKRFEEKLKSNEKK